MVAVEISTLVDGVRYDLSWTDRSRDKEAVRVWNDWIGDDLMLTTKTEALMLALQTLLNCQAYVAEQGNNEPLLANVNDCIVVVQQVLARNEA